MHVKSCMCPEVLGVGMEGWHMIIVLVIAAISVT